ncbi:MAG: hypothetical protein ASARMPRED_008433 [Alectoria sarmentosa]|nr:MAG: hypothetical protein ASARMPRED_008433 [Alectoria sarmentosa]
MASFSLRLPENFTDDDRRNIINAHNFEKSFRAHGPVSEDLFYRVPKNAANASAGTLLKVELETETSCYTLPPNLALSRFIYQSKSSSGSLVPVSAYVLWPYIARPYKGGQPVVIWAHGTSGVSDECAPSNSRHLWHHFQLPYQLALNGYVVVATDYAGLGLGQDGNERPIVHEYLTGPAQANDLFYSIPAARTAFPTISKDYVVIGSSQGGGAAWAFAEKLSSEPMTGHLGTVILHPVLRLLSLPLENPSIPLLLTLLAPSLIANFPDFEPRKVFTPEGMQNVDVFRDLKGCSTVLFQLPSGSKILNPGWYENDTIQQYQKSASTGRKRFEGPLLVIQGGDDPIVPPNTTTEAVIETAKMFPSAHIEYHLLPGVTHASAMYAGQHLYMDWIAARFAGKPTEGGTHMYTAEPVRPTSIQQNEANWFIQIQTSPWQVA